ncbi:DEKNAAC103506 [Brettanomyces naardenensis]|uniref:Glucoamylase 1 n=1 Tax=Brettanomyces naardenensis TaxID=13370 RepID=A0A448YNB5_BRENA|nr:DEKNAAC103506 [Brettanomyces naardenensis]
MILFKYFPLLSLALALPVHFDGSVESNGSTISSTSTSPAAQFTLPNDLTIGVKQVPNIYNESAIDANQAAPGYDLLNISLSDSGLSGLLKLRGEPKNIYGYDFDLLNLTVSYQSDERLNVHIEPVNMTDVFVLPDFIVTRPEVESLDLDSDLLFTYQAKQFGFSIVRKSTGESLFSTIGNPLVYENQFIQFNTSLPKNHVLSGLGESIHGSLLTPGTNRTLFAEDIGDPIDGNIYGVHPVYFDQRYGSNTTHAVWWRTSAIQEILIRNQSLTWRALSGVVDLYFFSGPTPKVAIQQYVATVGLPALQPYWSLGYHQCRWGYNSTERLQEVVQNFKDFDIPLETIWSDIDYMDSLKDFTTDPYRFPLDKFQRFLNELHNNDQHYVPIVDAAIYVPNPHNATEANYSSYVNGAKLNTFLRNPDNTTYIGAVWPGYTVFPDFFAENAQTYWTGEISKWHKDVSFDGLWMDMDEVSSFCVGSCGTGMIDKNPIAPNFAVGSPAGSYPVGFNVSNSTDYEIFSESLASVSSAAIASAEASAGTTLSSTAVATSSSTSIDAKNTLMPGKGNINYPPYAINNVQGDHDLATHAVSPNATHQNGFIEYDVHNLYGHMQTNSTYNAILDTNPGKRPFLIVRSTFPGSGKRVGHWGGDNTADFAYMYFSIPQAFAIGSFGIPFFGVDVCGFNGNTDMELCSRWMQLGSFFPFYRNHNYLGAIDQEPYVWEAVTSATKTSMAIRYLLLPYYYTLLHESHTTGLPFLRQFQWEFPEDSFYAGIDNQFFVGDSLLVTPVLEPNVSTVKGVFPGANESDVYYDFYTHEKQNFTNHKNHTLEAPLGHIPLHIRGGSILPTQEPGYTVAESRNNSFGLIVALGLDGSASGNLYLDDGESLKVSEATFVDFVAENNTLTAAPRGNYAIEQALANITILGVDSEPSTVLFGNSSAKFQYTNSTVFITGLEELTGDGAFADQFVVSW